MSRFQNDEVLRFVRAAARPDPARVLEALLEAARAERGFLVLARGGDFDVACSRHMDGQEVLRAREKISRTLLGRALAEGRPVAATDADLDAVPSLQGQRVRSVCVLPLPASRGAVYLDSRIEKGLFADLDYLDQFARALDQALGAARDRSGFEDLVGASPRMRETYRLVERAAATPYPVLVLGESGTGKELVARALHRRSPRAAGPFVAANCAALPETLLEAELFGHARGAFTGADRDRPGLFEQAHGGTLFLDEVACLSPQAQEALLRVLETGEVRRVGADRPRSADVRIVAATNEDLEISEDFRRDLFYRLNVLRIDLPPLRDRLEDLPLLAEHFLARIARETGRPAPRLAPEALAALAEYRWPGNVRELENALRRACALSDEPTLGPRDFAFLRDRPPAAPAGDILSIEEYIRSVLARFGGSLELQEIARRLGISRKTLWEKKKKFGL